MPKSKDDLNFQGKDMPWPLHAADLVAYELMKYLQGYNQRLPMQELMKEEEDHYWRLFDFDLLNWFCQEWTPKD